MDLHICVISPWKRRIKLKTVTATKAWECFPRKVIEFQHQGLFFYMSAIVITLEDGSIVEHSRTRRTNKFLLGRPHSLHHILVACWTSVLVDPWRVAFGIMMVVALRTGRGTYPPRLLLLLGHLISVCHPEEGLGRRGSHVSRLQVEVLIGLAHRTLGISFSTIFVRRQLAMSWHFGWNPLGFKTVVRFDIFCLIFTHYPHFLMLNLEWVSFSWRLGLSPELVGA